jgi:hypothetical protein
MYKSRESGFYGATKAGSMMSMVGTEDKPHGQLWGCPWHRSLPHRWGRTGSRVIRVICVLSGSVLYSGRPQDLGLSSHDLPAPHMRGGPESGGKGRGLASANFQMRSPPDRFRRRRPIPE